MFARSLVSGRRGKPQMYANMMTRGIILKHKDDPLMFARSHVSGREGEITTPRSAEIVDVIVGCNLL